jgi:hypothetical protein
VASHGGFPPKSTAYRWFAAWRDSGVFEALNHALLMIDRERSICAPKFASVTRRD